MDAPPAPPTGSPLPAPARPIEAVQRWRLTVCRFEGAPLLGQREQQLVWEASVLASGLPLALGDGDPPRPRVVAGAPLTLGMPSAGELYELFLTRRCPIWQVREGLAGNLPAGHELLDLEDVWLGEPPLPGRVVGAAYEALLAAAGAAARDALARAIDEVLGATSLPRERAKGDRRVAYDLRPFVAGLELLPAVADDDGGARLEMRLRHDPERGIGRPDEVLAELGERVGAPFEAVRIQRTALVLTQPKGVERAAAPIPPRGPRRMR